MKTKIKKLVSAISAIAVAFSLVLLTSNPSMVFASTSASKLSTTQPGYGIVNTSGSNLNVRQGPTTGAPVVGSLANGSYVMIIGQNGNFYQVQYNTSGSWGFVSKDYVALGTTTYYLRVNNISSALNLRESASTSSQSLCQFSANTYLAYVGETSDWYICVYGNVFGYVSKSYVSKANIS